MKNRNWREFVVALLWSELFIAFPSWLVGSVIFRSIILNPRYQAYCIRYGIWGIGLGMTLPQFPLWMIGMLSGYCVGIFLSCRLCGKARFSSWILGEKEIWLFSSFTRRILSMVPNY